MKKATFFVLTIISLLILSATFVVATAHPTIAHAQATIGTASIDGVDISATPASPAPGTSVTVSVVSYTTDLNGAAINWLVGGKSFAKGTGMTSVTVPAPAIGKTVTIMASISTVEGANIQKVVTIKSSSIDMIEETSGYVPPLYRGKEPFVYQNTLKIIAIPHLADTKGNPIDPKNLIYTWKQDSTVLGDQSGYDKQSLTITGALIARPFTIDVQVSSADGTVNGESEIGVVAAVPSVAFYQDDPLYGVLYNEAVGDSVDLLHNQLKIVSVPYGFDTGITNTVNSGAGSTGSLSFGWTVNNTPHDELASSTSIILATPSGSSGSSDVGLTIQNNNQILQTATAGFNAIYSDTSTQNSSVAF